MYFFFMSAFSLDANKKIKLRSSIKTTTISDFLRLFFIRISKF